MDTPVKIDFTESLMAMPIDKLVRCANLAINHLTIDQVAEVFLRCGMVLDLQAKTPATD